MAPFRPSVDFATSRVGSMSPDSITRFAKAVAAASARAVEDAQTVTASARPKLREGPTCPEDVQSPQGV